MQAYFATDTLQRLDLRQLTFLMQELALGQSAFLGRQMEVIAAFSVDADASRGDTAVQSPFAVGLQLNTGNGTYTRISINGTAAASQSGNLHVMQVTAHISAPNTVPPTAARTFSHCVRQCFLSSPR